MKFNLATCLAPSASVSASACFTAGFVGPSCAGYIVFIIESEAVLISLVGLAAGFVLSFAIGYSIHRVYGLFFEFSWNWALTAAAIGILGGAFGALYPAVRASNLDAVSALAYE